MGRGREFISQEKRKRATERNISYEVGKGDQIIV